MTFKKIERAQLELSILAILSSFAASNTFAQVAEPATPATVEACVALSSSADRLACYDSMFKAPTVTEPQVAEPMVAAAPPVKSKELEKSPPESLKDKVVQKVSDLNLIGAAPKFDPMYLY